MRNYASIATSLEKLLTKDTKYIWILECQLSIDTLTECLVSAPILIFLDWTQPYHVHINASSIALGEVLAQPREGNIGHLVTFDELKHILHRREPDHYNQRRVTHGVFSS